MSYIIGDYIHMLCICTDIDTLHTHIYDILKKKNHEPTTQVKNYRKY